MIIYRRGSTMIYVLMVIAVLGTTMLGAAALSMGSLARVKSDVKNSVAFNACQATLEYGISETLDKLVATGGEFASYEGSVSSDLNSIAPGVTASYTVVPSDSDTTTAWLTATVTYSGKTKSIRGALLAKDLGIWNNAVFAGTGASGRSINGNVDIRGSVHILGDGEPYTDTNGDGTWTPAEAYTDKNRNNVWDPGEPFTDSNGDGVWTAAEPFNDLNKNGEYDEPIVATDLSSDFSGGGMIGNNYSGLDATLEALIPASPKKNGVETLSAELRVKHGKVALSGTATVGQSGSVDSGTSKAKVDGTYVNDGWGGNQGVGNVYSDNGTSNAYDLDALAITFPILSGIGAKAYTDAAGGTWTNQKTYLDAKSLAITETTVTSSTAAFAHADAYGNSISFTPASGSTPATLTVRGIIKVPSGFQLGSKDSIRYVGNGTLYSPGDMNIDGDILPLAGLIFPTTARLGFIASNNLNLATGNGSSQLSLAGAFYAQNRIVSAKQNKVLGTFVASYFDMGQNVPKIYQVPKLKSNLPPAMPGSLPIISLKLRGWRERQ